MTNKKGFIYVLFYPYDPKEPLKIGRSLNSDNRVEQLKRSKKTGTLDKGDYEIAYDEEVNDCVEMEKLVHNKLEYCRVNKNRELFNISIREAIKTIRQIIEKYDNNPELELNDSVESKENKFWFELSVNWQQLIKYQIELRSNLSEKELIESCRNVIDYSFDINERKFILELYKSINYKEQIKKWYKELTMVRKKIIQSYSNLVPNEKELTNIVNLQSFNCNSQKFVESIKPIKFLKKNEKLDVSKTNIKDLQHIEQFSNLVELNIEQTKITDIEPLTQLKNLTLLKCYGTNIREDVIKIFKKVNPNCIVDNLNPLTK